MVLACRVGGQRLGVCVCVYGAPAKWLIFCVCVCVCAGTFGGALAPQSGLSVWLVFLVHSRR